MTRAARRTPARSRGRRPGGPDTRGQILEAARSSFAQKGYAGTTIRGVAGGAGVDAALVHHYFGAKEDLFLAALQIPVDPRQVVPAVFDDGLEGAGERLLRLFLSVWDDPDVRRPLLAVVRTSLGQDGPAELLQGGLMATIFTPLREKLPGPDADRRAQLAASQLVGLIVARYVLRFEPLASLSTEELVGWVAPTLQRYFTGPAPG